MESDCTCMSCGLHFSEYAGNTKLCSKFRLRLSGKELTSEQINKSDSETWEELMKEDKNSCDSGLSWAAGYDPELKEDKDGFTCSDKYSNADWKPISITE